MLLGIGNCRVQKYVVPFLMSVPNATSSSPRIFQRVGAPAMLAQLDGPALKEEDTLSLGMFSKSVLASVPHCE